MDGEAFNSDRGKGREGRSVDKHCKVYEKEPWCEGGAGDGKRYETLNLRDGIKSLIVYDTRRLVRLLVTEKHVENWNI